MDHNLRSECFLVGSRPVALGKRICEVAFRGAALAATREYVRKNPRLAAGRWQIAYLVRYYGVDKMVARMARLQEMECRSRHRGKAVQRRMQVECLRREVPQSLLRRFDHLIQRGRLGVAEVSPAGACGNCHLRLPPAARLEILKSQDAVHICPYCGCYLYAAQKQEAS